VQELEDLSSPVGAFIREKCEIKPGRSVEADLLFQTWCTWCKTQGRDHPGTVQSFGRDLRAACPGLGTSQIGPREGRRRFYTGIGLQYGE
jgi:putative DNA primase/helicase